MAITDRDSLSVDIRADLFLARLMTVAGLYRSVRTMREMESGNGSSINLCKLSKYHHWEGWERYKHRAVAKQVGAKQNMRA